MGKSVNYSLCGVCGKAATSNQAGVHRKIHYCYESGLLVTHPMWEQVPSGYDAVVDKNDPDWEDYQ